MKVGAFESSCSVLHFDIFIPGRKGRGRPKSAANIEMPISPRTSILQMKIEYLQVQRHRKSLENGLKLHMTLQLRLTCKALSSSPKHTPRSSKNMASTYPPTPYSSTSVFQEARAIVCSKKSPLESIPMAHVPSSMIRIDSKLVAARSKPRMPRFIAQLTSSTTSTGLARTLMTAHDLVMDCCRPRYRPRTAVSAR